MEIWSPPTHVSSSLVCVLSAGFYKIAVGLHSSASRCHWKQRTNITPNPPPPPLHLAFVFSHTQRHLPFLDHVQYVKNRIFMGIQKFFIMKKNASLNLLSDLLTMWDATKLSLIWFTSQKVLWSYHSTLICIFNALTYCVKTVPYWSCVMHQNIHLVIYLLDGWTKYHDKTMFFDSYHRSTIWLLLLLF